MWRRHSQVKSSLKSVSTTTTKWGRTITSARDVRHVNSSTGALPSSRLYINDEVLGAHKPEGLKIGEFETRIAEPDA